jgi:hypothetical protein
VADACLELSAVRTELFGLGEIVLDAYLEQTIIIGLARRARPARRGVIASRRLAGQRCKALGILEFNPMPLSRGLDDALTPRTRHITAPKLDLLAHLVDGLLVFFERLLV